MARSFAASVSVAGVKPIEEMYRRNVMRASGRIAFAATASDVSIRAASAAVAIGTILGIGAASAADLPPRTYITVPATGAEVYGWTGLYVGGNVGGVSARGPDSTNFLDPGLAGVFFDGLVSNPHANAFRNT